MDTATRRKPTTPADLHRLAGIARQRGLRLFEPQPGHWYCTSASSPRALHVVTGFSCDCAGFAQHGRCTHHSLLLSELGWLPDPDPEPIVDSDEERAVMDAIWGPIEAILGVPLRDPAPTSVSCPECGGAGVIYVAECEHAGSPYPRCTTCDGTGRLPVQIIAA
jgi:predicted RNA-binding Zn-ribbon protein involved in translation (DUF1610 family)